MDHQAVAGQVKVGLVVAVPGEVPAVDRIREVVEIMAARGRGVAKKRRTPKAVTVLGVAPKVDAADKLLGRYRSTMKRESGYTLIEVLIVVAIIGVLAAAALPQFYPFKTRAYDTDAKANLHNVFLSCKGYWSMGNSSNPCVLSTVSNNEYGFIQSESVEVFIGNNNNTEADFVASASHIWS